MCVCVRIIIDFCEGDMKGAETLLDTGSLNYGFWWFWKKLKKDLQKLGLTNGIWWFRDPDLDPVLTMVWVLFSKTWFFESRWYQGIESSRNQWIHRDVIWRVRVVGSEMFDSPLEWVRERHQLSSLKNPPPPCSRLGKNKGGFFQRSPNPQKISACGGPKLF